MGVCLALYGLWGESTDDLCGNGCGLLILGCVDEDGIIGHLNSCWIPGPSGPGGKHASFLVCVE